VYRDTSYRRRVPSSKHAGGWYSGDYQADFHSSHDYQSEESSEQRGDSGWGKPHYRDIAFSDSDWSQRRQLREGEEEDGQFQYYE
jgi:hypothetical protein